MPAPMRWLTPELINRLEALELSVKWVRSGHALGGRFPINRRGSSIEFADYAPYYPGDDIRAIDWNLYARLDRLFVKTYKEEIELSVELIVDATASMGLPSAEKFARAKQLAICLGYIALIGGHRVRVSWIAPERADSGAKRVGAGLQGARWLHQRSDVSRLSESVEQGALAGSIGLAEWMARAVVARRMHGGQAIVFTDGMVRPADFFNAMQALMVRNLELKVIQILAPQELHPSRLFHGGHLVDVETGATHDLAYSPAELDRAVADHNELLVRFCKKHGIAFAQHRLDESLVTFISNALPARGFLE